MCAMAEVDPYEPISVLFLSPKWQYDTYGVASVVRSLVNDLWLTDPDGQKIQMTCAVLQEDGKINEADVADAAKHNVKLRGVKLPRGIENIPGIDEINGIASLYYKHLARTEKFHFIIGHIPYLADGTLNFRDFCADFSFPSEAVLFAHTLPKTKQNDINERALLSWLKDAKIIFSIGDAVKSDIQTYIDCLEDTDQPLHYSYIPGCPAELLTVLQEKKTTPVNGQQNITVMTTEAKDLEVSGLNYELAVASSTLASQNVHEFCGIGVKVQFLVLAPNQKEKNIWEDNFNELKEKQLTKDKRLTFRFHTIGDIQKLKSIMKRTAVMLLPLKADSPLFGVEALMAAYSGAPILVSSNSGIASLMNSLVEGEAIVYKTTGSLQNDAKVWSERIIQKIRDPGQAQIFAESLRGTFLLDTSIAASHIEFIKSVTETSNYQLKFELSTDCSVLSKCLAAAKKFGVQCERKIEPNKYIVAYLTKLLLQREKLDLGVLDSYIPRDVKEAWKEFLSCLEQTKRKLLGVADGSLNFTLFCPTTESYHQLQQETWRNLLTKRLKHLISVIGIRGLQLTIAEPKKEEFLFRQTQTLPVFSRLRKQDEEYSGYGSESTSPVDQMSLIHRTTRVVDWLKEVDSGKGSSIISIEEPTAKSDWFRLDTIDTGYCYPEQPRGSGMWFSVGESGTIGVSFNRVRPDDSTLSVLHPSNPTNRVTLSSGTDKFYFNPVFIKQSGKEYLAVHSHTDASIHLWDTVNRTCREAYREELCKSKNMKLCQKDSEMVVYGEYQATNGVHNIHLLNTSTRQWSLRSTLRLQTGLEFIADMCYVQLVDGTPCLVLCNSLGHPRSVVAVEIVGGDIRWRLSAQQMGENFAPISVCTDGDHNIFVCDVGNHSVYVLSSEDGSVIRTVLNAQENEIIFPCRIQIQKNHLYVAHLNNADEMKWMVSKFERK